MNLSKSLNTRLLFFLQIIVVLANTAAIILFFIVDQIVNGKLYQYGLQFSVDWASLYWANSRFIIAGIILSAFASVLSIILLFISPKTKIKELFLGSNPLFKASPSKFVCAILLSTGIIALAFSINYTSLTLSFIGLGLIFWGILFLYIAPKKRVRLDLLNAMFFSTFANMEQAIANVEIARAEVKGVYLPPKYFSNFNSCLVFLPSNAMGPLPEPREINENRLFKRDSEGIFLLPPGLDLANLFEGELRVSLEKIDIEYLQKNLPKLFIEKLEIAEEINILQEGNAVIFEIKNNIFEDICEESVKFGKLNELIGCPLYSAIACVLAKTTGKLIVIDKQEQRSEGTISRIHFEIL